MSPDTRTAKRKDYTSKRGSMNENYDHAFMQGANGSPARRVSGMRLILDQRRSITSAAANEWLIRILQELDFEVIPRMGAEKNRTLVDRPPSEWTVHTGTQLKPVKREIQTRVKLILPNQCCPRLTCEELT
jgi:hypothetical protein